jgi:arabinogalactan endo-1,4-beta-galactosidase
MRRRAWWLTVALVFSAIVASPAAHAAERPFYAGVDISMLPEIEKAGGVYRQPNGEPDDAVRIFRDHGCNLFRVRLFVDPSRDFARTHGATQDLATVRALSKRIKSAGGTILLDLHYSDTWADPMHQHKPAAWKDLDFDALEQRVHDYTTAVLKDLRESGAAPEMVQVGNEVTAGILWPDGKVLDQPADVQQRQWERFARLFNAGARAVRAAPREESSQPTRVVLHIHGGGKPGLPRWFFEKFGALGADYDVAAISYYPAWGDSIDALKQNLVDVVRVTNRDVLVAETSYPWRAMEGIKDATVMRWPMTPEGQAQFARDLAEVVRATPDGRGIGVAWWYPEAIPVEGLRIWRGGAEALFDEKGNPLPGLEAFGRASKSAR